MHYTEVNRVLSALYELGDARAWNGRIATRVAELILPHTAADLTVHQVVDVLRQAEAEIRNHDQEQGR